LRLGALYRRIVANWKFALYFDRLVVEELACLIGLFRVGVPPRWPSRRLIT
jgi:hypothetical protein